MVWELVSGTGMGEWYGNGREQQKWAGLLGEWAEARVLGGSYGNGESYRNGHQLRE